MDATGALGERLPHYVKLVDEFIEWYKSQEATNVRRRTISNAKNPVADTLMETLCSLGNTSSSSPSSRIATENIHRDKNFWNINVRTPTPPPRENIPDASASATR